MRYATPVAEFKEGDYVAMYLQIAFGEFNYDIQSDDTWYQLAIRCDRTTPFKLSLKPHSKWSHYDVHLDDATLRLRPRDLFIRLNESYESTRAQLQPI